MRNRHPGQVFLTVLLILGIISTMIPVMRAEAKEAVQLTATSQGNPEKNQTEEKGLEKLSPDLRSLLDSQPVAGQNAAAVVQAGRAFLDSESGDPLLVSAMVQPGADVARFFSRSVVGRTVAGVTWVTGEISPIQLRKLVSISQVIGVISNKTYQAADAPGLDELRSFPKHLSAKQARALLAEGGPERLRARAAQISPLKQNQTWPADQSSLASGTSSSTGASGPNLLDIHDVRRARAAGYSGDGVVVGLVDTGVDFSHPDLVGTQAVIKSGDYAGWPFAYDTLSGYYYALNTANTIGPDNYYTWLGATNYAHTLPVQQPECSAGICKAKLHLATDSQVDTSASFTWPDKSKSKKYFYTIFPDYSLVMMAFYLGIGYSEGQVLAPIVIVSDEQADGVYDTVYVDINYDYSLNAENERMTRDHPSVGLDMGPDGKKDGVWDFSAGMLTWISDGVHQPPGTEVLYPSLAQKDSPAAGRLLAFVNDQYGHGTGCASLIAGQGKITDPRSQGPANPLYTGGPNADEGVIVSLAKSAKIAAFQDGFDLPFDAWILAAYGMDGIPNSGDEVNLVSNSWGDSNVIADGWDPVSRFAQLLSYTEAPNITFLVATGNGGHGYGTRTTPGGGPIIDVGASTAYGALRNFEVVGTDQFLYGEIQPWSNRGPGSLGDIAPDIVAVGAWGTAAVPLNYGARDGEVAYDVFGGTSMATPVAAGGLAIIYQAFRSSHDRWPTWQEARDILLGSASDLGYDVLAQGAGNIQVSRAVDMALGLAPGVTPTQWQAGNYRGKKYPAFPSILHPGQQDSQSFTVKNPLAGPVTAKLNSSILQSIHEETFTFAFSSPPPKTQQPLPIFLKDISELIKQYNPDLVRAQVVFPFSKFDDDNSGNAGNWWSVYFYDWTDRNGDKKLWTDNNYDGRVDDGEIEIDPTSGLYEFNRFTYGYPQNDYLEASLGSQGLELAKKHNGVFLGLRCIFCGASTSLQVRVTFYHKVTWDWLHLSSADLQVPGAGAADFTAALSVPQKTPPGAYEGEIDVEIAGKHSVLPVVANVAASATTFSFGGTENSGLPYDNAHMFGGFNWNWRYESGDWRTYFDDIPDGTAGAGKWMVVDTLWGSPATDIDTWLLGPARSEYSEKQPDIFGPQGLTVAGGSADSYIINGQFALQTSTGYSREIVGMPVQDGLNMIALHNVLNSGLQFAEGFAGKVYQLTSDPGSARITATVQGNQPPYLSGSQQFTLTSTADIPEGIQVQAFGMSAPVDLTDQLVKQDSQNDLCSSSWIYNKNSGGLKISNGGSLEINTSTSTPGTDLDLLLFKDDGDGIWNCFRENLIAYSMSADSNEHIKMQFPEDGVYWVAVSGYWVPGGQSPFNIQINSISGTDITLENMPVGPIHANQPVVFKASYYGKYPFNQPATLEGRLFIGLPSTQDLLEVPIQVQPDILLYPSPVLSTNTPWITQSPADFSLSFQNQGVNPETVQASIQLPDGLVYQPGSAVIDVPGYTSLYDAATRTIQWKGPLEGGQTALLNFQVTGQPGFQPAKGEILAQVRGTISGQEWSVKNTVWINQYGFPIPFIRR